MEISKLTAKHVSKIATLLRDYWKERGYRYTNAWAKNYLQKGHATEIKQDLFFVLQEGKDIIGTISLMVYEGNVAELRDFVIKEAYRGKGYGEPLLEHALQWCKKHKIRKVIALTFPNTKAFYVRYKFVQEGYLRSHFAPHEDLIIMSRFMHHQRERQIDLGKQMRSIEEQTNIEQTTAARLRKLPSRKQKL